MILKNKCRLRSVLSNPGPMAEVDNNLRDLHDSSYHTKAEFDFFFFFSKYFLSSLTSLPPHRHSFFYADTPKIFL